mmetsp:Transcript_23613/g.23363  ORF Transcript_23613/g.23363 Transcript_23613/m.23363 type:complete len:98 (+) Transcript_23613:18-311(+)
MAIMKDKLESKESDENFSLLAKSFTKHLVADAEKKLKDTATRPLTREITEISPFEQIEAKAESTYSTNNDSKPYPKIASTLENERSLSTIPQLIRDG